jgi:hypothetical protein
MSTICRWYDKLKEGAAIGNINLQLSPSDLEKEFVEAGYVNVKVVLYPLPMGPLPKVTILNTKTLFMATSYCQRRPGRILVGYTYQISEMVGRAG